MTEVFRAKNAVNKSTDRVVKRALATADKAKKMIKERQAEVKAMTANTDIAVTIIGQAVFTTLDQFFKRNMKQLDWRKKWELFTNYDEHENPISKLAVFKNKKYGGPGIIVIKDVETGKLAVTSTVDLAIFITEFSYPNLDSGKYGKGAQKMKVVDLYVHECETTSSARNGANKLRTRIRQAGLAA